MIKLDKVKRLIHYPNIFTLTDNKNIYNLLLPYPYIIHPKQIPIYYFPQPLNYSLLQQLQIKNY